MTELLTELVHQPEIRESILNSVSIDENGNLSEDLEGYKNIDSELIKDRNLVVLSKHMMDVSLGKEKVETTLLRVPYDICNEGRRYIEYADFPSAYFYGHKIIMVGCVEYCVCSTNGEVTFHNYEKTPLRPIKYDSKNHGLSVNRLLLRQFDLTGDENVTAVFHSIDDDPVQGVFLLVVLFKELTDNPRGKTRLQLFESFKEVHNEIIANELNDTVLQFLDNF